MTYLETDFQVIDGLKYSASAVTSTNQLGSRVMRYYTANFCPNDDC